jgi:DNA-binding transcriptional ArsR family regulator
MVTRSIWGLQTLSFSGNGKAEPTGRSEIISNLLTYAYMGMYFLSMARASTTSDSFNAIAEPRRREILVYLAMRERPVGEIVESLGIDQPSVSKHLRVLRDVGLVRVRCDGRHKFYQTNAEAIRPLHEWAGTFERYWIHQLNRVKERAEEKVSKASKV